MGNLVRFDHDPQGLLEELPDRWRGEALRAVVVLATDARGRLMWDGASYSKMELVWAMEKFKHEIIFGAK